jgi:DNA-binding MarR family transcriptional regulator
LSNAAHVEVPTEAPARLRTAVSRLAKRLKPTAAAGSLTTSEVDVIQTVARVGPVKLSSLAGQAGLNPTMLSRIVAKLEDQGLLRRLPDASDGRVCRVEVTEQGSRLHHRVRNERTDVLSHELDLLDADDRRAVLAALPALERLAEALLERAVPPGPPAPPAIAAGKERNER